MALPRDLFLAILSLDAYNREYGAALNLSGGAIDDATILPRDGFDPDGSLYQDWQDAGFYAVS